MNGGEVKSTCVKDAVLPRIYIQDYRALGYSYDFTLGVKFKEGIQIKGVEVKMSTEELKRLAATIQEMINRDVGL